MLYRMKPSGILSVFLSVFLLEVHATKSEASQVAHDRIITHERIESELSSLEVSFKWNGQEHSQNVIDVIVDCNHIIIKKTLANQPVLNTFPISQINISFPNGSNSDRVDIICDNELKCGILESLSSKLTLEGGNATVRVGQMKLFDRSKKIGLVLKSDFAQFKSGCEKSIPSALTTSNDQRIARIRQIVPDTPAEIKPDITVQTEPDNTNQVDHPAQSNLLDVFAKAYANAAATNPFIPTAPRQNNRGSVPYPRTTTSQTARPSFTAQPNAAAPLNAGNINALGTQAARSYSDHPELVANQCLSFHGPIDAYGERVTNRCGYTVAYSFCIGNPNSTFACKSSRSDIARGSDTIGAGQTQSTGYLANPGKPIGHFETYWHACRGALGAVSPVMNTLTSGSCMRN